MVAFPSPDTLSVLRLPSQLTGCSVKTRTHTKSLSKCLEIAEWPKYKIFLLVTILTYLLRLNQKDFCFKKMYSNLLGKVEEALE